ncbi:MAG TPA: hypothetical protein VFW62_06595 [bacterium]|nr:hypothetical protein [bacterium]
MTCPRIPSHAVPLSPEIPSRFSRSARRSHSREEGASAFQRGVNPADRLAQGICSGAPRGPRSLTSIPSLLSQADRAVTTAESASAESVAADLNRGVEAYNAAVQAWRAYESGRPAGAPPSTVIRGLPFNLIRERLLAVAERRGFRLRDLEPSPSDQMMVRPSETEAATGPMSQTEVSSAVLRLTRLRNRIRQLDRIEDDSERPMTERLRAAASALALTRQASELIQCLRTEAPNPRDARILRLSSEILHVACDDSPTEGLTYRDDAEWVAGAVRLYQDTARNAIGAIADRRHETGALNPVLRARLHLLRARRAAYALTLTSDSEAGARLADELGTRRVALQGDLLRQQRRAIRADVREATRLLARAEAVLGSGRRVSEERRASAVADYRRGTEILSYLMEASPGHPRVRRLSADRRWARLDAAVGRVAT